jgi:ADP-ribose pyrophosphatase YjhB (NUDIX family)
VIIKQNKILLSYVKDENFYFYIGGKMEYGETVSQACQREIKEECNANFTFQKILYVRDFIVPKINEHSLELFILGDIDKFKEIDGIIDPEFGDNKYQTWVDLKDLKKIKILPHELTPKLLKDYQDGFKNPVSYLGAIT